MKKNLNLLKLSILFLSLSFAQLRCEIKAIIFDFGGVLGKTDEFKFAREIGLQNLASLGLSNIANIVALDFSKLRLKEKVLEIMSELGAQQTCDNGLTSKHEKTDLPEIMCKWLRGEIDGKDANKMVQEYLEKVYKTHPKINGEAEKNVLSKIISIMFDAEKLAAFTDPIDSSLKILHELIALKDKNYKLLMLSNWCEKSFNMIFKDPRMGQIFDCFDPKDIFISGQMGCMKPSNRSYEIILNHIKENYGINPEECLMIDDQPENIVGAKNFKIQTILAEKTCSNLRTELEKLNILPKQTGWRVPQLLSFSWGANNNN